MAILRRHAQHGASADPHRHGVRRRRATLTGLLFVSPWILGFLGFYALPTLAAAFYSFTTYSILRSPRWIGLANFAILFHSHLFWASVWNTAYFTTVSVPLTLVIAFGLALLLNMQVRGLPLYRTIFYLPVVVPVVAVAEMWTWLLDPLTGIVTKLLGFIGIHHLTFFSSPGQAMPTLIAVAQWGVGGAVIIYLAGLQGIASHLYEASRIDGASWWAQVRWITIPMMTPVIFFNLILSMINALQNFNLPYLFSNGTGGVLNSLLLYALRLYDYAFVRFQMGLASAMAVLLFGATVLISMLVFRSARSWVFYNE